jgi:hypothetical protein
MGAKFTEGCENEKRGGGDKGKRIVERTENCGRKDEFRERKGGRRGEGEG